MTCETFMCKHPVIMLVVVVLCMVAGWLIADAQWNHKDKD